MSTVVPEPSVIIPNGVEYPETSKYLSNYFIITAL